jgi:hypothetical protein
VSSTDPRSNPFEAEGPTNTDAGEVDADGVGDAADGDDQLRDAHALAGQLRTFADQLSQLDEANLSEHVDFYQSTHAQLQRALSDIDNA